MVRTKRTAPAYSDCAPLSHGDIKQRFSASSRAGFRSKRSASYSVTMGESGPEQDMKGQMWGYRVGAQGRRLWRGQKLSLPRPQVLTGECCCSGHCCCAGGCYTEPKGRPIVLSSCGSVRASWKQVTLKERHDLQEGGAGNSSGLLLLWPPTYQPSLLSLSLLGSNTCMAPTCHEQFLS